MPVIGSTNPTLMDWTKQLEPDGGIATSIVDMLKQTNEFLADMTFTEANGPTFHRTTIRTGLPTATWRQFYRGVAQSKSTYAQVDETIGMLEARSMVDKDLAELNGDINQFRMNEAGAFVEAMNQTIQQAILYGNVNANPEQFNGFAPRFNTLNAGTATSENVVSATGSGSDNTSIWLVGWSPNTVTGLFPKGSKAGLQHEDLGVDHNTPDPNTAGRFFSAYHDKWEWKAGLLVRDWRYIVRIANIDVSNLVTEQSAADLIKLMTIALHKLPSLEGVRPAFYMNRTVMTMMDIQAQQRTNVWLNVGEEEGKKKISFRGIPFRRTDQITNAEAAVS